MHEFLGLQPPTKRRKTEMYMNVRSESLGVKRPWLKYIEEEKSMHYVTSCDVAEVDESIKQQFL